MTWSLSFGFVQVRDRRDARFRIEKGVVPLVQATERVDVIVRAGYVVTMDAERRIYRDGLVAVRGETIVAVGREADLLHRFQASEMLDARRMAVIPGLIDAHTHTPQAMLRSAADDLGWAPYLIDWIWPLQGAYTEADAMASLKLMMLECIKAGTVMFVEPFVHSRYNYDAFAQAVLDSGMRAGLAKLVMDRTEHALQAGVINLGMLETREGSLGAAEAAIARWHNAGGGRLRVLLGPRVPRPMGEACSPGFFQELRGLSDSTDVFIHCHLAGETDDLPYFREMYNGTPFEFAEANGLAGPRNMLVMCCHASPSDVEILARTGTHVVHCPQPNMKMASGVAPVPLMRQKGVNVALGTDSGANNNCYDIFREMKAASLLHNIHNMDSECITAEDCFEMATRNAARAVGLADQLGSIEPGKQADLTIVDLDKPHLRPVYDVVANLVYSGCGADVDSVMVAGRFLMRKRQVLTLDEEAILHEAQRRGDEVMQRAGKVVAPRWPVL